MSLDDRMAEKTSTVFLATDRHAEDLTRYIAGNANDTDTFTGVVTLEETEKEADRGQGFVTRGTIETAGGTTITTDDAVPIGGKRFEVERIGETVAGMKTIHVVRREGIKTTAAGRTRSGR